jgi:hypothetical protein
MWGASSLAASVDRISAAVRWPDASIGQPATMWSYVDLDGTGEVKGEP